MKLEELPELPPRKRISSYEILNGSPIPKIDRLKGMSEDDFEVMVLEWAHGYLKGKYKEVRQYGGAGDKGRDVVGVYENGDTDVYQCKHYDNSISPSIINVEFGKLCHYTFLKDYAIPKNYFIVAPQGVGSTLQDLLDNPEKLRSQLIENWEKHCQKDITSRKEIKLEGDFKKYVESFDFSIIKCKQPLDLIDEHSKTVFHPSRFGGGLIKSRDIIPKAGNDIDARELHYTTQLLDVYSEHLKSEVKDIGTLQKLSTDYFEEFSEHRDSFYSAESLEKFSRDNFPDANPPPFDELKSDALSLVKTNLSLLRKEDGYTRMQRSILEVQKQGFTSNPLRDETTLIDKKGLCHHLANDKKVVWRP